MGLNYHHLYYFWVVAREGSVSAATEELGLTQPTISGQLQALERQLGEELFTRSGRSLVLTDAGRIVYRYACEIFSLGRDLQQVLDGRLDGRLTLTVGVSSTMPELLTHQLLLPLQRLPESVRIVCRQDEPDRLVAALATHDVDVVLADAPAGSAVRVRAYNHLLGECGVAIYGTRELARAHRRRFPGSLHGAPLLMPPDNTSLRRTLDQWLSAEGIVPQIAGEIGDGSLLKLLGQSGFGMFAAPSRLARWIRQRYDCERVGELPMLRERYYAISTERRIKHPAVALICEAAREKLFA